MTGLRFNSARPCHWVEPRNRDARQMTHGPILPMEEPRSLWRKILGRG